MFRQMYEEKYMRFPQGKEKAFTLSYDDGVVADKKLLLIMDKYGLKGTFNLNSKLFDCKDWHSRMDEEQTFALFSGGEQEIALHGARHIFLSKVPLSEAANEIVQNRVYLEEKFQRIVNGLAYAYNSYNDEVVDLMGKLGVKYARTTLPTHKFALPEDWLKWHPTCHHGDSMLESLTQEFLSAKPNEEFKNRESLLFYVWGHSYEFDDNDNWGIIEKLAKSLGGNDNIWFATNIEIYNYCEAYKNLVFSIDGERVYNPSALDVWLDIRGKTYKVESGKTTLFDKEI